MPTIFSFLRRRASATTREHARCAGDIRFSLSPDARASVRGDGVVFLDVNSGSVFTSNRIGARIWRGLLEHEGMDAIAANISHEYAVPRQQVEEDAAGFIADLEAAGLLARNTEAR
jgi:hypothetical protein